MRKWTSSLAALVVLGTVAVSGAYATPSVQVVPSESVSATGAGGTNQPQTVAAAAAFGAVAGAEVGAPFGAVVGAAAGALVCWLGGVVAPPAAPADALDG
jgi:hypothetical protein